MKSNYKILVVDDDSIVRKSLAKVLQRYDHMVITAQTKSEAESIVASQLKLNLAIVDLRLPDGSGLDLLSEIKDQQPDCEVIILTGYGNIELALTAARRGVFQFLTKPFELSEMMALVERALTHREIKEENERLKSELYKHFGLHQIIGKSREMRQVIDLAERIAPSDSTVLISGESGTGKELIAKGIHAASDRAKQAFVAVNCGAIPEDLLESELFGHEKGSFTGAHQERKGRFELAHNGTIFLDEIGDMSPKLQVKLLRVLQEKRIERVGSSKPITINTRVIAATHKNLEQLIKKGQFREDLYFRLNVIPIHIPSLKNRKSDLPILINYFIQKFNQEKKKRISGFSTEAFEALQNYTWPGNVRELENLVERLTIIIGEGMIQLSDLPPRYSNITSKNISDDIDIPESGIDFNQMVSDFENKLIMKALEKTGWNRNKAAHLLKINRTTLVEKIKKKGLKSDQDLNN